MVRSTVEQLGVSYLVRTEPPRPHNDDRGVGQGPVNHMGDHLAVRYGTAYDAEARGSGYEEAFANLQMMRTQSPSPIGSHHSHPDGFGLHRAYSSVNPPRVLQQPQQLSGFPADVAAPHNAPQGRSAELEVYSSHPEVERTLSQRPTASAALPQPGRGTLPAPEYAPVTDPTPAGASSAAPAVVLGTDHPNVTAQAAAQPAGSAKMEGKKRKRRIFPRFEFKLRIVRD